MSWPIGYVLEGENCIGTWLPLNLGVERKISLLVVRAEPYAASGLMSMVAYTNARQTKSMADMEIRQTSQGPFKNAPTQIAVLQRPAQPLLQRYQLQPVGTIGCKVSSLCFEPDLKFTAGAVQPHCGLLVGGASSIMHALSRTLVHFPLEPAWLCLICCRK